MYYILNSAVITSPGSYEYELITPDEAREWARAHEWHSTVGYAETAAALSYLLRMAVSTNRVVVKMEPGDEALVFRLVLPPHSRRIPPELKGQLRQQYITEHAELGLIRRTK